MILGARPVTLRRAGVQTIVDHRPVYAAAVDSTIYAGIQAASQDDVQVLPEGERSRRAIRVYTTATIQLVNTATKTKADRFVVLTGIYAGVWEAMFIDPWDSLLAHHKVIALKDQEIGPS